MTPLNVEDLVGRPFEWHARGPEAFDCWGLVRECLLRAGVCNVPDYRSATEGCANAVTILDAMAHGWEELKRPGSGCVVLFRMDQRDGTHVGYMLTPNLFAHTTWQTGGVVIERLCNPLWCNRIVGFYRWKG